MRNNPKIVEKNIPNNLEISIIMRTLALLMRLSTLKHKKMKELKRFKEVEDDVLGQAYSILSEAGFDILIENGQMSVWYSGSEILMDYEEGMVIVPEEYQEEFDERQEELEEENS